MGHSRIKHTVNGKLHGVWYETEEGSKLYLAHRKADEVYKCKACHAWCIDVSLLERCRAEGFHTVGIVRREGKNRLVWLTPLVDFFDSPHSFPRFKGTRQRALPLSKFRIDPAKSAKYIESAVKIR